MSDIRELSKEEFPIGLSEIPDSPDKIYLRGRLPDPSYKLLTIVGSRKFSDYGRQVCEKLIEGLAGYPISIVSGLALGIDGIAHKAALKNGLHTIAVPGSGISDKTIYPRTNFHLAQDILKNGGAILSELEPETKPATWTFPKRNRIMAGMSDATLVIEAGEKSGTLITARLASDYNKELLVVPGSIFSPSSRGCHQFLKLGATPVFSSEDIVEALGLGLAESKPREYKNLSKEERQVVELLSVEPLSRDELIQELGLDTSETNSLLTMMEIKNLVSEQAGKICLT